MTNEYSSGFYAQVLLDDWRESIASEIAKYDRATVEELFPDLAPFLSDDYREKPGAVESDIRAIQLRLGLALPEDYLAFVKLTDEWPAPGLVGSESRFLSARKIGLYRDLYPTSYQIWMQGEKSIRYNEQICVYGPHQLPERFCRRHLNSCIAITTQDSGACYVLNPNVVTSNSCEAWLLDFHLPGAMRFPSFFALIEYEIPRSVAEIESVLRF